MSCGSSWSTGPSSARSCVHVVAEGGYCFPAEVQALINVPGQVLPRRVAVGPDRSRLAMLIAVPGGRAGVSLSGSDVFAIIAGGIRIDEPATDIAVALALAPAERGKPLLTRVAAIGEISLTGELRSRSQMERHIAEAGRAGFEHIVLAADVSCAGGVSTGAADVRGVLAFFLGESSCRLRVGHRGGRARQGV